jgi:hypothetical protein
MPPEVGPMAVRPSRRSLLVPVASLLLLASSAEAYIDPGTGSYVFQMAIAGLVTAGFLLKVWWRRLVQFFRRRPPEAGNPDDV